MKKIKLFLFRLLCSFFPEKKEILFESNPDMACNTYEVYKYLINKHINDEWRFVWLVRNPDFFANIKEKNVVFMNKYPKGFFAKLKKQIRCNRALISISCNAPIPKYLCNAKQLNIYLDHGSPLKRIKKSGEVTNISCDYLVSQAPFFNKYLEDLYGVQQNQILLTGIPRNDQFFHRENKLEILYPDAYSFKKIVAWVPTFRVAENPLHQGKSRIDCDFSFPLGIPLVYSAEQANELNEYLVKESILLVFKPHPAQDLSLLKSLQLPNFRFLYDAEMLCKGVQTNEFLKCTDAIITDYSGIYYDYLLTDRPIAISLDDYTEYKNQQGFVFENPLEFLVGEYLYNYKDLIAFLSSVLKGIDNKKDDRIKIKDLTNYYQDGKSTERFFDFIKKRL